MNAIKALLWSGRVRVVLSVVVCLVIGLVVLGQAQAPSFQLTHRKLTPRAPTALGSGPKSPVAAAKAAQFAKLTGGLKLSQVAARNQCERPRSGTMACVSQKLVLRANGKPVHPSVSPSATFTQVFPSQQEGIAPMSTTGNSAPDPGTPAWLQQAYDLGYLAQTAGAGKTVAIVDAYDDPTAESDLGTYRATYGLPPCTTANGCFTKVNGQGNSSPLPGTNAQWEGEIGLDLDAVSAICPNCHILLVETGPSWSGLAQGVQTAASWPGVVAVSNSYGAALTSPEGNTWTHPGVPTVFGTGDSGTPTSGVFYPAAYPGVTAAGGTNLISSPSQTGNYNSPTQLPPVARGFNESAWAFNGNSGGGSGCNTQAGILKPSYQTDTGCTGRSYADVSADADPMSGIHVYSTVDGGWVIYGGTSLSTPLISAYLAISGANNASDSPSWAYSNASRLNDPTGGSTATGSCPITYICTAGPGYDGPTGAGSISGAMRTGAPGIAGAPIGSGCLEQHQHLPDLGRLDNRGADRRRLPQRP